MSFVTDMIVLQIGNSGARMVAEKLGVPESVARMAISAALPMILAGLGRNASKPQGAEALAGAIDRDHDGGILGDLMGALGNQNEMDNGSAILGHILGNKQNNAQHALGQSTGLDDNQSADLMKMLAPVVMGQLGQTKREQGLDASGLADLLGQEKQVSDERLGGMAGLLDMDGDGDLSDDMLKLGSSLLGGLFK